MSAEDLISRIDLRRQERQVNKEHCNHFACPEQGSDQSRWKVVAVPDSGFVALYDLKTGKMKSQLAVVPDAGSKNTHLHVDEIAFCSDGSELAVIASGTTSDLQVFSTRTGRAVLKHTLSERVSSLVSVSQYAGPVIETLPGKKGYILYGCIIVDREKGGPIWVDKAAPGEMQSNFRVLIDDEHQVKLTSNGGVSRFEVVKLPWSEISNSKDLVAKGGTVEDTVCRW